MSDQLWGVLIGGSLTLAGTWLVELLRGRRDTDARRQERQLKRDDFQRATLLEAQEALIAWARFNVKMALHDRRVGHDTGVWGRNLYPEGMSEGAVEATQRLTLLRERIVDDGIREAIEAVQTAAFSLFMARSAHEMDVADRSNVAALDAALRAMGARIRALS